MPDQQQSAVEMPSMSRNSTTDTPIFIFSSGRCGSTLIQRVLNTFPDVTIWGEHHGFLRQVADSFYSMVDKQNIDGTRAIVPEQPPVRTLDDLNRIKSPDVWQAWMNYFQEGDLVERYRSFLNSIFVHPAMEPGHVWGFKEIRYGRDDRVIDFLHHLYPNAHFVFLCRNGFNTVASKAAAFHGAKSRSRKLLFTGQVTRVCKDWRDQYLYFHELHYSSRLQYSHWIAFEDLVQSLDPLEPLLRGVGREIGPAQLQVLEMDAGRGATGVSDNVNDRSRFLNFFQVALTEWALGDLNSALGYETPPRVGWMAWLRRRLGKQIPQLDSP